MVWQPVVEQRLHPFGEAGVRSSLEEVARKATAIYRSGEVFSRVKAWAGKKLHAAKMRGLTVDTNRARADILLRSIQTEKLWVPDPIGMEYIVGPHMMACDVDEDNPEGVCIQSEDCDSLTVLLAACCLSVGLHVMIVAHGYDKAHPTDRRLQHVLCKIMMEDGAWLYADPSYNFALGTCHPFTRERVVSLPDQRVLCDDERCDISGFNPDKPFLEQGGGVYIGLDGAIGLGRVVLPAPREFRWLHPISWLGAEGDDVSGDTWDAFYKTAEERDFGTSDEDLEAYGTIVGATAAAGACAATGVGAAAAPLCGYIGGKIGGYIVSIFTGDSEEEAKRHKEQALAWAQWEAAQQEARQLYMNGTQKILANLDNLLHYGAPPPQYKPKPEFFKKVLTLKDLAEALSHSQELEDYYRGDTGVGITKDNMFLGLGGAKGSIAWRMVKMFGWGKQFNAVNKTPTQAGGWGNQPPPPGVDDNVDMTTTYDWVREQYADWIVKSIYCGGTLAQVKAGSCYGSMDAGYVTSGKWKERIPLAQERIVTSLKQFSSALGAAATPQIAEAAAIRASRENPPSSGVGKVVVVGGLALAAAVVFRWI